MEYKMYLIKEYPLKIQVACEKCSTKGYIDKNCPACHGRGIHNKTLSVWKVSPKLQYIEKIDRESKTEELRYWEDLSCFYYDNTRLVHFNIKDAQNECNKRNIQTYGMEFYKQYLK